MREKTKRSRRGNIATEWIEHQHIHLTSTKEVGDLSTRRNSGLRLSKVGEFLSACRLSWRSLHLSRGLLLITVVSFSLMLPCVCAFLHAFLRSMPVEIKALTAGKKRATEETRKMKGIAHFVPRLLVIINISFSCPFRTE